jgi:hypothetical protein
LTEKGVRPLISRALEAFSEIRKVVQKELVVRLGVETRLAVVAALNDVNG